MRIAGLPRQLNDQLEMIPKVVQYYEELSLYPSYQKTGQADEILSEIPDDTLRDALIYIGKHNSLPLFLDVKRLINGDNSESYRQSMDLGQVNLRFLIRSVKSVFMNQAPDQIHYARQAALFCTSCGEYKATGMFEFPRKDKSYTDQIRFTEEHIIDPDRTEFRPYKKRGKRRKQKVIYCVPCGSSNKQNFEKKYGGLYASGREHFYTESYLEALVASGSALPKVTSVRIRTKEPASATEKLAYLLSGNKPEDGKHLRALQENRRVLESELDEGMVDMLLDASNVVYDKFGIRLLTNTVEDCYDLKDWFKRRFKFERYMDYIAEPKENGYQSIHATLVGLPSDMVANGQTPVDLQIRTREMHRVAQEGSAAWGHDKKRRDLVDRKLFLAMTVFRYYLFGA
ncbi:MAG: hypothetical protein ABIA62_02760 [Candidatus Woesearchaeota archaeon]